ncbi:hypothetical protein [Bradyrhizobium elkanii]|nr:hypothetical protein [Bradyrhizobium elkanii]
MPIELAVASEAKQSMVPPEEAMDCFVASAARYDRAASRFT